MTDWAAVLERHGPAVWRLVRQMVGNDVDAEDCFQETFMSVASMVRSESVRNWSSTLRAIAANKAVDCLRRRYRDGVRQTGDVAVEIQESPLPEPSEIASRREWRAAFRQGLAHIDPRQAEVFCLVCLESMTYNQAAEALGLKPNYVGVLLTRARKTLRETLQDYSPIGTIPSTGETKHVRREEST